MPGHKKKKMLLIWHEAGNPLYEDRFSALAEKYDLTVHGFSRFQGVNFFWKSTSRNYEFKLFRPLLGFHWLTAFSPKMLWSVRKDRYDYIYLHEEPHSLLAFLYCLFYGQAHKVVDAAIINKRLNFRGFNFFEKFVYRRVNTVFYRNDDVRDVLVERGCPDNKLKARLGNGVSEKSFRRSLDVRLRDKLNLEPDTLVVGYAGRIWYWKGIACLKDIAALPRVKVVACGPVWDESLANDLKDSGVELLSKLGKEELVDFYSSIDLFILPSLPSPNWVEQFGRVVVESVFCGAPAIGSNAGFISNLVGDAATFDAGNVSQILALVQKFKDKTRRQELLDDQQLRLRAEYSWEAIAEKVHSII